MRRTPFDSFDPVKIRFGISEKRGCQKTMIMSRREIKKDDVFMKTNDSWKSKGSRDMSSFSVYQKNSNRRLSEPKRT